jgi:hypothetical protein
MGDDDLTDARVDELFTLPPEEFTAARDRLVRALRDAGDRDAAARVKGLRRPTAVAWALNGLARRHRDEVETLIAAGEQLRQAQRKAMSGLGAEPMRAAQRGRRAVVDQLTGRAAAILAEHGTVPQDRALAIRRALEAASVDAEAAAALLEGRLSQPPEAASGFGAVEGLTLVTDTEPAPAPTEPADDQAERRRLEVERAADRLARAEQAAERAAADRKARRRAAEDAARAAGEAEAAVGRLSRELDAAREELRRSTERAEDAAERARAAEAAAEECEHERNAAARELDRLQTPP